MQDFKKIIPPKIMAKDYSYTIHGVTLQDPYAWLRDENWKTPEDGVKNPIILKYLNNENKYTESFFEPLKPMAQKLFEEKQGFLAKIDESVPVKRDDYYYYSRQSIDQNYPIYLRKYKSLEADEEVIMDLNQEAMKFSFFRLGSFSVSPSHKLLAYSVDTVGNEFFELKIRKIDSGEEFDEIISQAASVIWKADASGFYYLQYSAEWRPKKLFFHKLGTPVDGDILLFEETDDIATLGISRSYDRQYMFLESGTKDENEIYVLDLELSDHSLKKLFPRKDNRLVSAEHYKGNFYYLMNDTGPNFRWVKQETTGKLTEIIPHKEDRYLKGITPYKAGIVISMMEEGLDKIALYDLETSAFSFIKMPGESYQLSLSPTTYEDTSIRFFYSALNKPYTIYACPFEKEELSVLKVQEIPSGFNEELYVNERIWLTGRDGVKIPISLAYRRDLVKKGQANPVLLYGYGSYGYGMDGGFRYSALSMMNQGFIYAIAHIRGGDDLGYQWYLDGKMLKKKNTFNDFIDCAEHLVSSGYTTRGMISAMGGSAGGLLMGVVVNERPDLFKAIIAHVPFVDALNTMLDETLPLTPGEFVEWGNPKKKEVFEYICSYSPYENVKKQAYPAMYITGGLTDPRVTYWEPTKWVAKLRDCNTSNNPILLKMNMSAGHAGGSKREEQMWEDAEDLTFLLKIYGKEVTTNPTR